MLISRNVSKERALFILNSVNPRLVRSIEVLETSDEDHIRGLCVRFKIGQIIYNVVNKLSPYEPDNCERVIEQIVEKILKINSEIKERKHESN